MSSEIPSLPVTWRPLGIRLAGLFFGALLGVVCLFAWLGFDEATREAFTFLQKLTLVLFGVIVVGSFWLMGRCRLTAAEQGVTVVNGFRTYRHTWDEVRSVEFQPGTPWVRLGLTDGAVRQVVGLQATDGLRTERAVRQLRALLAERRTA
jgi:hypothetical protein